MACRQCLELRLRVAELQEELADVREYAGRLHEQVHRDAVELQKLREPTDATDAEPQ